MKFTLRLLSFLLAALSSITSAYAQGETTKIISQPNSPVTITGYMAKYQKGGSYARDGIRHDLNYTNTSARPIRAIQFGLVSFGVFNDFLDKTNGIDMAPLPPSQKKNGAWVATAWADFSFFTGVAYVSRVRFIDGELWEADEAGVLSELRQIEADFDAKRLNPEPPPRTGN